MKMQLFILSLLFVGVSYAQDSKDIKNAKKFQQKLNKEFSSKEESPLTEEDLAIFESLQFFPIDSNFIVNAKLTFHEGSEPFAMKTTTDRLSVYRVFATATFKLHGEKHVLRIYQSQQLLLTEEYNDYLFLPFTDESNGSSSYGGGRFIDLKVTDKETIIIDFNKA